MKVSLAHTALMNEPDKYGKTIAIMYEQNLFFSFNEKNSGDAVLRLGTVIQSIFCAQSDAILKRDW